MENKFLLDRVNLPIRVCDLLRNRIIANELPDGAKLSEDSLAKELGVSRTPVREAFNRLAQEGLVTVLPGPGEPLLPLFRLAIWFSYLRFARRWREWPPVWLPIA